MQDFCVSNANAMTPYYGLAAGFLTGKYRDPAALVGSARAARVQPYMDERGPRVLAALDALADALRSRPVQVALAWLAARPGVGAPITSATGVAQIGELIDSTI